MKIHLIQTALHWHDWDANYRHFEERFSACAGSDLVLIPEMFGTGFSMEAEAHAKPNTEVRQWILRQSKTHNFALCGSAMVEDGGKYYNRLYFATPSGECYTYDKKHLFTLAGEQKVFTAGREQLILPYKGWKIKPLVCYDLRFPAWARNTEDYDLLLYVANWPDRRIAAWDSLLQARAIENMSYVAAVNRTGPDGNEVLYSGHSVIYDPLGQAIAGPLLEKEGILSAELNREEMLETRERFGFLRDRDQFEFRS